MAEEVSPQNAISTVLSAALEAELQKMAPQLLSAGDVKRARLLYLYLAAKGVPEGAYGVGDTYNPVLLSVIPAANAAGDGAQATNWYRKAVEMERQAMEPPAPPSSATASFSNSLLILGSPVALAEDFAQQEQQASPDPVRLPPQRPRAARKGDGSRGRPLQLRRPADEGEVAAAKAGSAGFWR